MFAQHLGGPQWLIHSPRTDRHSAPRSRTVSSVWIFAVSQRRSRALRCCRHILAFAERSLCSAAVPRHTGSELGRSVNRELVGHTLTLLCLQLLHPWRDLACDRRSTILVSVYESDKSGTRTLYLGSVQGYRQEIQGGLDAPPKGLLPRPPIQGIRTV